MYYSSNWNAKYKKGGGGGGGIMIYLKFFRLMRNICSLFEFNDCLFNFLFLASVIKISEELVRY